MPNATGINNMDSEDMMGRLQRGDTTALNALWKMHYRALVFFAMRLIEDSQHAEDIVSEAFMKLWTRRSSFPSEHAAKAFLYLAVRNACYDHLKLRNIHHRAHKEILYTAATMSELHTGNDLDMMYAEYIQALYLQIAALPPKCAEIFRLFFFDQLSTQEIACRLSLSEQTVRNQKNRAIQLLRAAFVNRGILPFIYIFTMLHY